MSNQTYELLIVRRAGDGVAAGAPVTVPVERGVTLAEVLEQLAAEGMLDTWPSRCPDGTCGACGVVVDGKPVLACATRMDDLDSPVTVAPLTKLPGAGHLVADRAPLRDLFERVGVALRTGDGSPFAPNDPDPLARCIGCGLCMEACPQFAPSQPFVGPAVLAQVARVLRSGAGDAQAALDVAMHRGGAQGCANAQACVEACPMELPLIDAIGQVKRRVTLSWLREVFGA